MAENKAKECGVWLNEALRVFPNLAGKDIRAEYKEMSGLDTSVLNYYSKKDLDLDPEGLLLGENTNVRETLVVSPKYEIFVNSRLLRVRTPAIRKPVVQHSIMHHLLAIEEREAIAGDATVEKRRLVTHSKKFDEKVFQKFNQLRELSGIAKIEKIEHLETAIHRIMHTINWWQ
ncbi:MAG: hypothetical protein V1777_00100 [Candidatus Micrarchaeota archaeon]